MHGFVRETVMPMCAADFYTGIVPDVYAALRATTFGADRYLAFVHQSGQPALELGCGDDGPFLELARQGVDIEGVDSSPDMLERCRARADADNLRIVTHCQRMENLDLPRRYRAIFLAGPTFTLLPDDDTAQRALLRIAAHLLPDGTFMVPLWIPPATPAQEFGRTRETTTADGATARYTIESEGYDETTRTRRTHTRYEMIRHNAHESLQRDWIIHWHTPAGIAALAQPAGLEVVETTPIIDSEFTTYLRRR